MRRWIWFLGIGLVIVALISVNKRHDNSNEVGPNVSIASKPVGGLTRPAAETTVRALSSDLLTKPITLRAETGDANAKGQPPASRVIYPRELHAQIDIAATVDAALHAQDKQSPLSKLFELDPKVNIEPVISIDEAALISKAKPLFAGVELAPQDADFTLNDKGNVELVPSKVGRGINTKQLVGAVKAALGKPTLREVPVRLTTIEPKLSTSAASQLGIKDMLSTFTTPFNAGEPRVTNIRNIASMLQSTVIPPGKRFSVNETVGPRTLEKGFVQAPVIYDGEFSKDIGGGVSQFATTLFNAAFFAGVPIKEHKPHSKFISRYPIGREATLSYPHPDLAFVNDYAHPLFLKTAVADSSVTVWLLGTKDGRSVSTTTTQQVIGTNPSVECVATDSRAPGTEKVTHSASKGYLATVTRITKRANGATKTDTFNTRYDPGNKVIEYGGSRSDHCPPSGNAPNL